MPLGYMKINLQIGTVITILEKSSLNCYFTYFVGKKKINIPFTITVKIEWYEKVPQIVMTIVSPESVPNHSFKTGIFIL